MQSKLFADPDDNPPAQQGQAAAAPPPTSGTPAEAAKAEYDNWELCDDQWAEIAAAIQWQFESVFFSLKKNR